MTKARTRDQLDALHPEQDLPADGAEDFDDAVRNRSEKKPERICAS
jgi:hypothetical protein